MRVHLDAVLGQSDRSLEQRRPVQSAVLLVRQHINGQFPRHRHRKWTVLQIRFVEVRVLHISAGLLTTIVEDALTGFSN